MTQNTTAFDPQRFMARFYHALDGGDAQEAAAFFTQDGTWRRKGETLCGPAQVAEALAQRARSRTTCHSISNFIATKENDGRWTIQYYLTVFDNQSEDGMRIAALMFCQDELELIDDEPHIAAKTSKKILPLS